MNRTFAHKLRSITDKWYFIKQKALYLCTAKGINHVKLKLTGWERVFTRTVKEDCYLAYINN